MFKPSRLFISYRRSDAQASARALCEALRARFGADRVFFDTSDIPFGEDFQRLVRERIAASDVVLALIGPHWLNARNHRGRRLEQSDDPVRLELLSALEHAKRIVPVRIEGATAPAAAALPAELRALAVLNMPEVRSASFDIDVNELVRQLLGEPAADPTLWARLSGIAKGGPAAAALIVAALLAASWTGLFDLLNLRTQAQRLLLMAGGPDRGEPVLLVTIDAASEHNLGRAFAPAAAADWRRDHARLIERAAQAGAAAVVFDLFFEAETAADATLAAAARHARAAVRPMRVVFGVRRVDAGTPVLAAPLRGAAAWGSLCLTDRGDGMLWSAPLAVLRPAAGAGGELVSADTPSLALSAVVGERLLDADLARRQLRFDGPARNPPLRFSSVERQRVAPPACAVTQAGDDQAMLLMRVAPAGYWRDAARSVSYAQALDPLRTPAALFKGRIVLVGPTALDTPGANPDVHVVRSGYAQRTVYGAELQADAIRTLAGGRVPQLPTADRQLLSTLAACALGASVAVGAFRRPAWQRRGALLAIALAWLALAWWLARGTVLLDVVTDLVALGLTATALHAVQVMARRFQAFRRIAT
jgi:CHASE2 domain-containing sensor protein